MLVTNHVLSGAAIGAAVRRPGPSFALGVASHFALDGAPHWGEFGGGRRYLRVALLAGMAGAALPDLDKPSRLFFGRSPFPPAFDRFHTRIQHEASRRAHYEATAAVIFALAAFALLRGRERKRAMT